MPSAAHLLSFLPLVACWTTLPQTAFGGPASDIARSVLSAAVNGTVLQIDPRRNLGRIWHYPAIAMDTQGLGGGITYAWDPLLCDAILPIFREDIFFFELITCKDIQQSMSRAFHAWSNNHRFLSFLDVTQECERIHGGVYENCSVAELWVTFVGLDESLSALGKASGDVTASGVPVALATSTSRYVNHRPDCANDDDVKNCMMFLMTNGVELPGPKASFGGMETFIETYKGKIAFGITKPMCWYLDSQFCSTFHHVKKWANPSNVKMATRMLVFVIFTMSALSLLFRCHVFGSCHRMNKRKKGHNDQKVSCSCRKRCRENACTDSDPIQLSLSHTLAKANVIHPRAVTELAARPYCPRRGA
uniref:Uncharacterized protein n=1 Tax=Prymnesium polylepis TaxID=72548 RepID=A0A7S4HEX3_9EUKA